MNILKSSNEDINIMIVIDTDYVKQTYPNPSQIMDNPTGIDHTSQFMICTSPRGIISGQGTADLNFKANPGDHVSFRGTSIYGNSDDAIIVYGIKHWQGNKVFNNFTTDLVERNRVAMPNIDSDNGLPAITAVGDFISYDSQVRKSGQENFYVQFALYDLQEDGNTQKLVGFYYWDPGITVQL
ncbi:MAG: inclusion body family protein [Clostridium sp.]|nr:inclusion body family protein [Clostridium sp.]